MEIAAEIPNFRPHEDGLETTEPFVLHEPAVHKAPLVFSSPHSGRHYPDHFLKASRLDQKALRASEDYFVDRLFSPVVDLGLPLLAATYPRAYVDLNREPYELDQRMFADRLPAHVNTRSVRVAGGLGTVARVVSENREIYARSLSSAEALDRIEHIYRPWHDCLRRLLARAHVQFGHVVLVDCHSMPSGIKLGKKGSVERTQRADFILGDRYGTSCTPDITDEAQIYLKSLGYSVARNKPYAGGFITEHYGRPAKGLHSLQIEINRALYVDEVTLARNEHYTQLKSDLKGLTQLLMQVSGDFQQTQVPLAAE